MQYENSLLGEWKRQHNMTILLILAKIHDKEFSLSVFFSNNWEGVGLEFFTFGSSI